MRRIFWVLPLAILLAVAAFYVRSCGMEAQQTREMLTVAKPADVLHDTVIVVQYGERVVVQNLTVPRVVVKRVHDTLRLKGDTVRVPVEVPRYYVKTKYIEVAAKCDSAGLTIDSLKLENHQSILVASDQRGNSVVDIQNSNPYFKSADVKGFRWHAPVRPRLTHGLQVGVGLTPAGVMPYVGYGLTWSLQKAK